jgi:hypothetical protein
LATLARPTSLTGNQAPTRCAPPGWAIVLHARVKGVTRESTGCSLHSGSTSTYSLAVPEGTVGATFLTQVSGCSSLPAGSWGAVGGDSTSHGLRTFRSLAGNRALVRVVVAYALFVLTEYSVWLAMLVYAYRHGGPGRSSPWPPPCRCDMRCWCCSAARPGCGRVRRSGSRSTASTWPQE